MSNIKEVIINPNKPADVKFVQYDTGQKLYVKNSPDFDFTNTTEIQITDGTESAARYRFEPYGDGGIVALPDTMFRNAGILKGYIFSVDPHGHTTEALISIGIRERPVYNEYISDADEEVVIPAGFEVIQNPESVTIKAYNTDGTVTEGTVENGSDGEPGAPGERGSDGISPEASIEQTATGAVITVKDARGTTTATLENGHDGNDGISPTAKVEQTAGGAKVTITDRNGTTVANLTNGQPGQPGSRGQDGTSPSINIDTITGGHRLTITDESHGTQYVDILDGERGRQGDKGDRGDRGLPGVDGVSPTAKVTQTLTGATVTVTDGDGTTTATLTNGRDGEPGVDGISPTATVEQTETGARVTITDKNGTTTANLTNGAPGLPGSQGLPGVDGYSPIATVTQTDDGAEISITDRNGTTEAVVRNGAQGLPGVNGVSPSIVVDDIPGGHRLTIYDEQHGYQRVDVLDGHTIGVPFGGETGQVLKKVSDSDFDTEWADEEGGGVADYPDLTNKPQINGNTLIGNKTGAELGLTELVELTQAEYDALESIDPDVAYFINDADPAALGTAAFKDYTDLVRPGSRALVESNAVYSAINNALSSIYTPRGNIDCADLTSSLLVDANVGNVYETNDSGTTTALFMQGAGKTINAGDNVGVVKAGQNTILFNLMGNAFDLTNYQKKDLTTPAEGQTTVEGAIGALATNKQEKTLTTPVESRTTVETALEALSSVKQPKTLTTAVEGETTVEDALLALSTNKQAKTLSAAVEGQNTVEGALGALSTNKATQANLNAEVNARAKLGAHNWFILNDSLLRGKEGEDTSYTFLPTGIEIANVTSGTYRVCSWWIKNLKPNTDYILSSDVTKVSGTGRMFVRDSDSSTFLCDTQNISTSKNVSLPFNTGTYTSLYIAIYSTTQAADIGDVKYENLLLRLADDASTVYGDFSKTNTELTKDVTGLLDNITFAGAKNFFNYDAWKGVSVTRGTAVFENNGVTLTATGNDAHTNFNSSSGYPSDANIPVQEGVPIALTWDLPSNDPVGDVFIFPNGTTTGYVTTKNYDKRLVYTPTSGVSYVTLRFGVSTSGNTCHYKNVQVTLASNSDNTYAPYAMTNKQITDIIPTLATQSDLNKAFESSFNVDNLYIGQGVSKAVVASTDVPVTQQISMGSLGNVIKIRTFQSKTDFFSEEVVYYSGTGVRRTTTFGTLPYTSAISGSAVTLTISNTMRLSIERIG